MLGLTVPATVLSIADEVRKGCRLLRCIRTLLAQSGHARRVSRCPLLGVKRTLARCRLMSAPDPKRTKIGLKSRSAAGSCVLSFGRHDCAAAAGILGWEQQGTGPGGQTFTPSSWRNAF